MATVGLNKQISLPGLNSGTEFWGQAPLEGALRAAAAPTHLPLWAPAEIGTTTTTTSETERVQAVCHTRVRLCHGLGVLGRLQPQNLVRGGLQHRRRQTRP